MRFMSLYRPALREDRMVPPTPDHMAAMGKLIADETKRGTLVSTGGLMSSAHGARVRRIGDDVTVTDGPFAETKELIGGYAILQVTSKAEAIDAAKRFIRVAGDGVCELRPFFGPGFAPREGTQLFMSLWRPSIDEKNWGPPSPEEIAKMGKLIEDEMRAGVLVATGGLTASAHGARVGSAGGKITIVDGPFAEAKELIAGFAILEVKSKGEAIEVAKRFLDVVGNGESEVRPMFGSTDAVCGAPEN
jgi:hypothetical protein